jgi:3-deoxy-D-manno-octulosonic-acid transferase
VHAQSAPDAARLYRFRLPHLPSDILTWGNLKYGIPKLPVDEAALAAFRAALPGPPGAKRAWIAASTHAGEEERVLVAHRILSGQVPDLVTIIAPRHPERGDAVAALAAAEGWQVARRSRGGAPVPGIYLVDTLGELGLFYRAAPVAFVGGSLVSIGGHNVLEPARLGVPVLVGPYTATCEGPVDDLEAAGGLRRVQDAVSLAMGVAALLSHPARARACGRAGQRVAEGSQDLPQRLADLILSTLP